MDSKHLLRVKSSILLGVALIFGSLFLGCAAEDPLSRGEITEKTDKGQEESSDDGSGSGKLTLSKEFFDQNLLPQLDNKCSSCHDNPASSYDKSLAWVVVGQPETSELYTRATGQKHKKVWAVDSAEAQVLYTWILGQ